MKPEYKILPYRPGVGLLIFNAQGEVFIGERLDNPGAWQMPQGGIDDEDDTFEDAVFRELYEETGIKNAEILKVTEDWLYYDLPNYLIPKIWGGRYRGQKQKWVALRFTGPEHEVNLHTCRYPEFGKWQWICPTLVLDLIVPFKRNTYETVFKEFQDILENPS
ncbi:MAG: RNA pyrophosphohydrolase [Pseudomonadota bacterium]